MVMSGSGAHIVFNQLTLQRAGHQFPRKRRCMYVGSSTIIGLAHEKMTDTANTERFISLLSSAQILAKLLDLSVCNLIN